MKTNKPATLLTFLAITLLGLSAHADDAAFSRQLVGSWKGPGGQTIVLKKDGTMTSSDNSLSWGWYVRDGVFHQTLKDVNGETVKDSSFKIISLINREFVIQDLYHGRHTGSWTRITPASGDSAPSR